MGSNQRERLFHRILKALDGMPDLLRQTFILSHYRGLSPGRIAQELGVNPREIPSLLRQADHLLYQELSNSSSSLRASFSSSSRT